MDDASNELSKLTEKYKKGKADEVYEAIVAMALSKRLEVEDPKASLSARQWVYEQGYGKTPDKVSVSYENAPWVLALRKAARGVDGQKVIPVDSQEVATPIPLNGLDDDELIIEWRATG